MVAILYRMQAGFPGDPNRAHPFSIEPCLVHATTPPTAFGQPVVIDATTNTVRPMVAGDVSSTVIWGITVRPYPFQAPFGTAYGGAAFGAATPAPLSAIDVLRSGYIMAILNAGSAAVKKGSPVFVWTAVTSGNHIQGGFESAANAGNTAALDPTRYMYNGPADALGNVEVICNP